MIADYVNPRACWKCLSVGDPTTEDCFECRRANTEVVKVISTRAAKGAKSIIEIRGELRVVPTKMLIGIREELPPE